MPSRSAKILAVLALSGALAAPAFAQEAAPTGAPVPTSAEALPKPLPLVKWEFMRDHHNMGMPAGWHTGDWASQWQDVEIPHVFDPQPTDELFGGTIGWYRTKFTMPATPEGFSWTLDFDGARRETRVWLNGVRVGTNTNPYQPFELKAKSIRPGVNELVVRVHNVKGPEVREGWWNWGGLVRPVQLSPHGPVQYNDAGLLSDVECRGSSCGAVVRTDGWLRNTTAQTRSPLIVLSLKSPSGRTSSKTIKVRGLKPGERRRVGMTMRVEGTPELWSPEHPSLYKGFLHVREGEEVFQHDERRTGLRYIRVEDGMLYLNGRRLQLRGASVQEDLPGRGPALHDKDIEQIVQDLKSLGANVTRAHYLLNERLLRRLDEEGILVWSQAPVYHEDKLLETPSGLRNAMRKVRGTVLAARNHPSVMTHSVANELSPYPDDVTPTYRFMVKAARVARRLDSTVPVSIDLLSYPRIPKQDAYVHFGLLGINSYYGWYRGKRDNSTERLSDLSPYLNRMRRKYPFQALMLTEFGAEATYDGPADVKETFAFQENYLARTLDIVDRLDWLGGAIYWTAREFYVKPNWDGGAEREGVVRDALHNKGLIFYDGGRKPSFRIAKARFSSTPWYDDSKASPAKRRRR
jgi:beta-galactosidase/beta-glucuronidase